MLIFSGKAQAFIQGRWMPSATRHLARLVQIDGLGMLLAIDLRFGEVIIWIWR